MIIGNPKDAYALILLPSFEKEDKLAANDQGAWLDGPKGKALKKSISLNEFCVSYAIPELIYDDEIEENFARNPTFLELEDNLQNINSVVRESNCDTVFCVGSALTKLLIDKKIKLSAVVGKKFTVHLGGKERTLIPTFDPGYVYHKKSSLIPEFRQIFSKAKPLNIDDFIEVCNPEEAIKSMDRAIDLYKSGKIDHILFDTETTSLSAHKGELIMYSWAHELDQEGFSVPLQVQNNLPDKRTFQTLLPPEEYNPEVLAECKEFQKEKKKLTKEHQFALLQKEREDRPYTFETCDLTVSEQEKVKLNAKVGEMISTIPIVGHNLKFDIVFCAYHQIANLNDIKIKDDTLAMAYQIFGKSPKGFGGLSLKNLAKKFCDVPDDWEFEVHDWLGRFLKVEDRHFGNIPTKILGRYAALDAYYNKQIYMVMKRMLKPSMKDVTRLVTDALHPFASCEIKGMAIDKEMKSRLEVHYRKLKTQLDEENKKMPIVARFLEAEYGRLWKIDKSKRKNSEPNSEKIKVAAENLNSFLKLREILYSSTYYGLPKLDQFMSKKTKMPETGKDVRDHFLSELLTEDNLKYLEDEAAAPTEKIEKFREAREFIKNYNQFKRVGKLLDNYLGESLEGNMHGDLQIPNFKVINGTTSGRVSSGIHTLDSWSDIKRLYVSRWKGRSGIFLAPDFSQLELRVAGCVSGDKALLDAYREGTDIHKITASKIFKCKLGEVDSAKRKVGKCVTGDTLIATKDGMVRIDEIVPPSIENDKVVDFEGDLEILTLDGFRSVKQVYKKEDCSITKVTLEDGTSLETTDNHPYMTSINEETLSFEKVEAKDLIEEQELWVLEDSYE